MALPLLESIFRPARRMKRRTVVQYKRLTTQLGGKWIQPFGLRLKSRHSVLQSTYLESGLTTAITERGRKMSTGPNFVRRLAFRTLVTAAEALPSLRRKIGSFIVEF